MRKNKGITLIALIITIIILLILVGVSLNLIIKGDLFGSAEKAVNGTNAKVEEEQSRVDELMDKLDKVQVHNWVRSGDNVSCNHCGLYLKIGQEIMYKDTGAETSTLTATKSGLDEDQTIEKGSDVRWVVFGVEDTNKDGRNESLLLTTVKPTKTSVAWGNSELEYENGESELNRICKELYGNDARSITAEDINSTLGYKPTGAIYPKVTETTAQILNNEPKKKLVISSVIDDTTTGTKYNVTYCTTGNFTTKLKDLEIWNDIKSIEVGTNGDTVEKYGDYTYNAYNYYVDKNGNIIEPINSNTAGSVSNVTRDMIFGTNSRYRYLLATKTVEVNPPQNMLAQANESMTQTSINSASDSSGIIKETAKYLFKLGMTNVGLGAIGGGSSGNINALLKSENNEITSYLTLTNYIKMDTNKNFQKTAVVISNIATYCIRPIVTLTDNIPEQGNVITTYEGENQSSSEIRDSGMAEEIVKNN